MGIRDATLLRLDKLREERNLSKYELANVAGIPTATVYSIYRSKRSDIGIVTLKKICDGLDMSMVDFFDHELFHNLEQEIK